MFYKGGTFQERIWGECHLSNQQSFGFKDVVHLLAKEAKGPKRPMRAPKGPLGFERICKGLMGSWKIPMYPGGSSRVPEGQQGSHEVQKGTKGSKRNDGLHKHTQNN